MWPWLKRRVTCPHVIGPLVRIRGQVDSEGELTVFGCVEGEIVHNGRLIIGQGARCTSNVQAAELELAGEVHGNLQVEGKVELRRTARLYGDIRCGSLQIEEGAVFSGTNRVDQAPVPAPVPALIPALVPALIPVPVPVPATVPAMAVALPPEPVPTPLEILMEPVGRAEKEVLGVAAKPVESPAFYGGFSPAVR